MTIRELVDSVLSGTGIRVLRTGSDIDDGVEFHFAWFETTNGCAFRVYWENGDPVVTSVIDQEGQLVRAHGVRANTLDELSPEEYTTIVGVLSKAIEHYKEGEKDACSEAVSRGKGGH